LALRKFRYFYENFVEMEKLTPQEEMVMEALWKTGEGNLKMIMENIVSEKPYTTLASTIKKLESKNFVKSRLLGNNFLYKPVVTEKEYYGTYITKLVKSRFANSYKQLVNFFVEQEKISPKELKEIIDMVEKNK